MKVLRDVCFTGDVRVVNPDPRRSRTLRGGWYRDTQVVLHPPEVRRGAVGASGGGDTPPLESERPPAASISNRSPGRGKRHHHPASSQAPGL